MTTARAETLFLDSSSWLELHATDRGWRAELHHPRRVSSVGYVDQHEAAEGDLARAVAGVLAATTHDADEILARLRAEKGIR